MKTYVVIGLGRFGQHVVRELIREGVNIICIDNKAEAIKEFKDIVEDSYILDSTDKDALTQAGVTQADIVIVSLGDHLEASILTLMALKELGINNIIIKAINTIHGEIYAKMGANRVIYPQRDVAKLWLLIY